MNLKQIKDQQIAKFREMFIELRSGGYFILTSSTVKEYESFMSQLINTVADETAKALEVKKAKPSLKRNFGEFSDTIESPKEYGFNQAIDAQSAKAKEFMKEEI